MPDAAFWACVKTHPQREAFAAERLTERGFEIFLPKIEIGRTAQPLFRSYLFIRVLDRWRAVETTFGVLCLVRFGDCPARCPDREVEALMDRVDPDGVIRLPPPSAPAPRVPIRKGARVKVLSGPFQGLAGLYQGQKTRERELVLMRCLGSVREVAIPRGALAVA
jgi:transcriptional antiterminator RfaH